MTKSIFLSLLIILSAISPLTSQAQKLSNQKGLLWQVTGNGLKKPSYVYGTMHVSQKIAFHLGDSFYIALSKCDIVALEQDLDSVIHRWISEGEQDNPEEASKVYKRNNYEFLNLYNFTLNSYNKELLSRKLSAEVREVNYLLKRGEQGDFEEDAWLDLYIYQIAKKLGKGFTGVEGFEESRDLVKKAQKEPKDSKAKKPKRYNYKLGQQIADAYRKGDIYMLDSIDRMTESDHYREYMLYKRNANMVRRMDSIMQKGKTLFTGVGCSHLPGTKGVLQMLADKGYTVRPVQSIALEKSSMARKLEEKKLKHTYHTQASDDGLISARLPTKLTKVNDNSYYTSYLSPDLANGYYYQIEKIACNTVFSGQTPEDILLVIDTMIFENIPGEISSKKNITSNGFSGIEVVTELKTGDLNRFQILASPFNVYIIRMAGKKDFAASSDADAFFKSIRINEGNATTWRQISSPDSVFTLELPNNDKYVKLPAPYKANPSFEHTVYDKNSGSTYLLKQEDILNEYYMEEDSFELNVMAKGFSATDQFSIVSKKHFNWQGYHALDATFRNKTGDQMAARFVICGTRYIMFLAKPAAGKPVSFSDKFFSSVHFNGKPAFIYTDYDDTSLHFKVKTPILPLQVKKEPAYYDYEAEDDEEEAINNKYKGQLQEVYFKTDNAGELVVVNAYKYGYYESQDKDTKAYYESWKKNGSLKLIAEEKGSRNGVPFMTYTYTDTNTTRQFKVMNILHGQTRYYVKAYLDTVSGSSDFVRTFFNTFDVSEAPSGDDVFRKKGYRFFQDFTSGDSVARKASIKNVSEVTFTKQDVANLTHVIDTISMQGDAAGIRTSLIRILSQVDSADQVIIPYLQKLYKRFSDTAFLQIEILKAIAQQKNDKAFFAIKPFLALDIPISDNSYDMQSMLYAFSDSLKLAKIILPELLELTTVSEYRNTAYRMISRMKDSGIINENDYSAIHSRLVQETKIEYKRMMASLTKVKTESRSYYPGNGFNIQRYISDDSYSYSSGSYSSDNSSLLRDILDLSLPLKAKNATIQEIASKVLKITNNRKRMTLLPVLLKYNINFDDSVYESLANNVKTRVEFYKILAKAKKQDKFPVKHKNQKDFVLAGLYAKSSEYNKIDTVQLLKTVTISAGNRSALIYTYLFRFEGDDDWNIYLSDAFPTDTNKLNETDEDLLFYKQSLPITPKYSAELIIDYLTFQSVLAYTRNRNGGYYSTYGDAAGTYGIEDNYGSDDDF
jgi:uncharacterized protein YbaP (TraB family)